MERQFEVNGSKDITKCPRSPEYESVIEAFSRNVYDPSLVGNLAELKNKHNCEIKNSDDAIDFANQEIKSIDHHSAFLERADLDALKLESQGNLGGVGATFSRPDARSAQTDGGPISVVSLLDGSPANKAGLKIGDQVIAVDKKPVDAEKVGAAVARIKGAPGTDVELTVKRDGQVFDIRLTRALVHYPAVEDRDLGDNVAYVRLGNFMSNGGPPELYAALRKHENAKAVVLDLRDNFGGALSNAMAVSSLFMDSGLLQTTTERVDSPLKEPIFVKHRFALSVNSEVVATENGGTFQYSRLPDLVDVPLVVLVNERSASASEMVAAALRDNGDAVLVGSQTLGKGVGQNLIPIPSLNGMLKVTNYKAETPGGEWLGDGSKNRIGLKPDIEVKLPAGVRFGSPEDAQLNAALLYLKTQVAKERQTK